MKKIFICIPLLFFYSLSFSQSITEPSGIYLTLQPSAKAEAMGKGLVANQTYDFGTFYNPASTSLSEGLILNASISNKYSGENAKFNYQGASYNFKKAGSGAISRYYLGSGPDNNYNIDGDIFNFTLYTLNYSREVLNDFFVGVNLNLITSHTPEFNSFFYGISSAKNTSTGSFDLGILNRIVLKKPAAGNTSQAVMLGASFANVSGSSIKVFGSKRKLPRIFKAGASYDIKLFKNNLIKNTNAIGLFAHIEFEKEMEFDRADILKAGNEITLFDILSLRTGVYYIDKSSSRSGDVYFTYGAGLNLPVNNFTDGKLPFKLNIDYVNLKHLEKDSDFYIQDYYNYENFNVVSMKLSWLPQ